MDENQLKEELKKYYFFHIIKLTENLSTPGDVDRATLVCCKNSQSNSEATLLNEYWNSTHKSFNKPLV